MVLCSLSWPRVCSTDLNTSEHEEASFLVRTKDLSSLLIRQKIFTRQTGEHKGQVPHALIFIPAPYLRTWRAPEVKIKLSATSEKGPLIQWRTTVFTFRIKLFYSTWFAKWEVQSEAWLGELKSYILKQIKLIYIPPSILPTTTSTLNQPI